MKLAVTPSSADARTIARQEVASLCGLVLRRMQEVGNTPEQQLAALEGAFAEGLKDFGGDTLEPGPPQEERLPLFEVDAAAEGE